MRTHGVARGTARQALAQLVNWGLAEARNGSGIYVRDFRPIVREDIGRLGSSTWPSGASVWSTETAGRELAVDQVEVSEADAPHHVRALLGLEQGAKAVLRSRRYVLDGKPVLLSRSWLPAAIGHAHCPARDRPRRHLRSPRRPRPRPRAVPRGHPLTDAVADRGGAPSDRGRDPGRRNLPGRARRRWHPGRSERDDRRLERLRLQVRIRRLTAARWVRISLRLPLVRLCAQRINAKHATVRDDRS
jgi:UTRA domain/Bacterial regulatory proteins, gntR family